MSSEMNVQGIIAELDKINSLCNQIFELGEEIEDLRP